MELYTIDYNGEAHSVEATDPGAALDVLLERYDLESLVLVSIDGTRLVVADEPEGNDVEW